MIIVLATVESSVEDIQALRQAIVDMEAASAKEPGNISYSFSAQIANPNTLQVVECWESTQALAAHFNTPHMAAFNEVMAKYPPKSVTAQAYDVAREVEIPMPK